VSARRILVGFLGVLLLARLALGGIERGLDVAIFTADPDARNARCDSDTLWHLATGRVIVESGHVPDRDSFTDSAGETRWVNGHWLGEVILWELYRAGGIELDWLLGVALWLGTVALVHVRARRRATSPWATLPPTLFALALLRRFPEVRPQGWTFLLLAAALLLVERPLPDPPPLRGGGRRVAVLLGLVLVLAEQLDAGFAFLYAVVAIAALATGWERRSVQAAEPFIIAFAIGLAGFALHPHHLHAAANPFRYLVDPRVRAMANYTFELVPPDMTSWMGPCIEVPGAVILVAACLARRRFGVADGLLVIAFGHLALVAVSGLAFFAIVAAGPLATAWDVLIDEARAAKLLGPSEGAARAFARFAPHALLVAFLVTAVGRAPKLAPGVPGDLSDPLLAPHADAADIASFIAARPPAVLFNARDAGSVLLWRLAPERKVFVDGRGDLHAASGAFGDEKKVLRLEDGWESVLEGRGVALAVVEHTGPLEGALRERRWRALYENATFSVLAPPGREGPR
jgi:hypothetical protein